MKPVNGTAKPTIPNENTSPAPQRELAWRLFASEYTASSLEFREDSDKSPAYIITPLGAKVNRIIVVGILTELENIGADNEVVWKARITDPTGVFFVNAGQYQAEAAQALANIKPPAFVAVVGKVRTYRPDENRVFLSIRAETIQKVDASARDRWILITAKDTWERAEAVREAKKMLPEKRREELEKLGYIPALAEGIEKALEYYGDVDVERYLKQAVSALESLMIEGHQADLTGQSYELSTSAHDNAVNSSQVSPPNPVIAGSSSPPSPNSRTSDNSGTSAMQVKDRNTSVQNAQNHAKISSQSGKDSSDTVKETVLQIIKKLDVSIKGAKYEDILSECKKKNILAERVEEAINALIDTGEIYEPTLGWIKYIE